MKKLYLFALLYITAFNTPLLVAQSDLELVKPIINIADSLNGGYYGGLSVHYPTNFSMTAFSTNIYTGAIVKNNGQDTITNYFLKVNAFMHGYQINDTNITLFSDTLSYLAPSEVDTIRLQVLQISANGYTSYDSVTISYQLFHDSIDIVPENDSATLPTIHYNNNNNTESTHRLGEINDTVNLINHPQYPSGSFIGISTPEWLSSVGDWGEHVYLFVQDSAFLQSVYLELRIYEDTTLLATYFPTNSFLSYPNYFNSLTYIGFHFTDMLPISWNDSSILTVGIYFEYDTTAANIPPFNILADTGNYHLFEAETRALVNGTWQPADFVPLIIRGLLWESIEEYQSTSEVSWFPNPASEQTTLRIRQANLKNYPAEVSIMDITGKKVLSAKVSNNQSIDISALSPGVYMVLTHINGQRFASKLIKP